MYQQFNTSVFQLVLYSTKSVTNFVIPHVSLVKNGAKGLGVVAPMKCGTLFTELFALFSPNQLFKYILAGPALFRGRLRAFGKCTNGVASLKGRQNLDSVRVTLQEKQQFPPVLTCSNLSKPFDTCLQLFTHVHTCSHMFTPLHTSSYLIDQLCSSHNGSVSLNFPLVKAVILRSYMLSCCNCIFLLT